MGHCGTCDIDIDCLGGTCDIDNDCCCGTCDIDNVEYCVVGWCIEIGYCWYRLDIVDID